MHKELSSKACAVLRAIIAYKETHDGNAPSLQELANALGQAKSTTWLGVQELERGGFLQRQPGGGRTLQLVGGGWQWTHSRPYPSGRKGDVLRVIVDYKSTHDGNAPGHREIAARLGVVYSGAIKGYLDELMEEGFIETEYASDRFISVYGGRWGCDATWLAAACPQDE